MRLPMRRAVELALGAAAAALLVLLVIPWKETPLPGAADVGTSTPASRERVQPERGAGVQPETIVRLFTGGRPAAPASPAPPPDVTPIDAPWLRYMGRSSDPDGTLHVYVKDTKSGKVINATRGEARNGWILVAEGAEGLTLRNGGELYAVSKR
jgi:hypothetical protein